MFVVVGTVVTAVEGTEGVIVEEVAVALAVAAALIINNKCHFVGIKLSVSNRNHKLLELKSTHPIQ